MTRNVPTRATYLMCAPDHFSVRYRINPWMRPKDWAERERDLVPSAHAGWQRLSRTLESLGAQVIVMPPQPDLPDLVFTANAAVVLDGIALMARFRHPERSAEEPHYKAFFERLKTQGYIHEIRELPAGLCLEGAGDCIWDPVRQMFWVGYGQRSDRHAAEAVAEVFGQPAVSLQLRDPRYYHLDTCLCPLESGHVLYVPEAFTAPALQELFARVPEDMRIRVPRQDAEQLAANAVAFDRHIVLSHCGPKLRAELEAAGHTVHEVRIPEFAMSGGSACCLTLRLDRRSHSEPEQLRQAR